MKVLISGRPGVGKTTVFMKVIDMLRGEGVRVGGFTCPEVRVGGIRIGFDIVDLGTGEKSVLSRVCGSGLTSSLRVGKYCVNPEAWRIGCAAVSNALSNADLIAIDEVGPMELMIPKLKECIEAVLLNDSVTALLVVHRRIANQVKRRVKGQAKLFWVTMENRDRLPNILFNQIMPHIRGNAYRQ